MSTTSPTFDLTNYVTGDPTSAPITKGNFEAITEWATVTKFGTGNLQAPYSNIALTVNAFGVVAPGTYYGGWQIPANQLAWVPIEAQLENTLMGAFLTASWEVYVAGVWVPILSVNPLNGATGAITTATAFVAPYSGGIAAGTRVRAVVNVFGGAASDNVVATLFMKAYHIG